MQPIIQISKHKSKFSINIITRHVCLGSQWRLGHMFTGRSLRICSTTGVPLASRSLSVRSWFIDFAQQSTTGRRAVSCENEKRSKNYESRIKNENVRHSDRLAFFILIYRHQSNNTHNKQTRCVLTAQARLLICTTFNTFNLYTQMNNILRRREKMLLTAQNINFHMFHHKNTCKMCKMYKIRNNYTHTQRLYCFSNVLRCYRD